MYAVPPPYNYAAGDRPQPANPPQPPSKRTARGLGVAIVLAMLACCLLGVVGVVIIGSNADRPASPGPVAPFAEPASEPAEADPTTSPPPPVVKAVVLGAGTYLVGKKTDADEGVIAAGTWKISTPADGINCYWARLKNFDGELTSIRANGNVPPGARAARVTVKASDAGLELAGDCEARK